MIYNRILSLFISFIMLFNLTADIFAAPALLNKKEQQNITNVLQESYQNSVQEKDSDKIQNTDICKNLTQDLKYYKTIYENSLNNLTKIAQEYDKLDKLVPEVVKAIDHENVLTEQYNLGITHNQEKIEEYEQNLTLHKNKLEELGGEEAFEEEYNLYQTWLALKPQIEEDQKLQEEIIKENTKILEQLPKHPRKKIKENTKILEQLPKHPRKEIKEQINQTKDTIAQAQQKLQDYQENYFSYQDKFSTFEKQLNYLQNLENKIMITNEEVIYPLESISAEIDRNKIEKNFFLEEFSLQENLNENSDWADILKSIETIVNNKEADLKNAKSTFRTAEKNLANKESCIFQEKMNAELPKAIDEFCVAALAQKSQKNLDPKTEWARTQTEYQVCINPVWEQKTLNKYAQNITMEDIADYKYIEYLGKYSLQEGQDLSINKQIEIGQKMAQIVKDLVLLNIDAALTLHYNIMGDREQAKILAKEVEEEWLALGGTIEQQSMHGVNWIGLKTNGKKDLIAKQKYYSYRHKVFLQVPVISTGYINQIHEYISALMLQVAQDKSTKNLTISSSVQELNNILNSNTLNEDTINAKFAELNHNWTENEKEDYANSIKKRPFDPIMFAFGFSHVIDRNRTLSREQRNAKTGIELNKSESLRNIINFNTHLQSIPQKDQLNISAWNELAEAAYKKRASVLLGNMVNESSVMRAEYADRPSYYSNKIEASLHEEAKDLGVDFLTSLLFTGFNAGLSATGRAMIKSVIKASANSVKKGLKMFVKREALLANKNLTTKALNNVTKKDLTLINKLQFETPIKHTRHTLGRELGAKNAIFSRIKNSATSRGSRIFNTQFSDAEYKSLSSKLKGFYNKKQETKIPHLNNYEGEWTYTPTKRPVKRTSIPAPTPKRPKARPEFADNIQRFIAWGKSIFKSENKKVTENAVEQATKQDLRGTTTKVAEEKTAQDLTKIESSAADTWITDTQEKRIKIETKEELTKKAANSKKKENIFSRFNKEFLDYHHTTKGDTSFVNKVKSREVNAFGKINKKEIDINAQEIQSQIDEVTSPYREKGSIITGEEMQKIVDNHKNDLLKHVSIPKKLNTNTWGTFYQDLKYAMNMGDKGAKEFYDRYLSNMLEPDSMIVFDHPINIPGMNPEYKIAISIEKAFAVQSDKTIMTMTEDGLKVVNAHQQDLGENIYKLLTGDVKAVFERYDGGKTRYFVITDWVKNSKGEIVPTACILETDEKKGVSVLVSNYSPRNQNTFINELLKTDKETGKNIYRQALYIDSESADIINKLPVSNAKK